jgi:hypothetical protein
MPRGRGTGLCLPTGAPFLVVAGALASIALLVFGVSQASATTLALPDGRAWEMVSPPAKGNSVITGIDGMPTGTFGLPQAAAGGGSFVYASNGAFAGSASAPLAAQYLATRGASGWSTTSITPKVVTNSYGLVGVGGPYRAFSEELSSGLLLNGNSGPVNNPPLANGAPKEYQNYYVQEALGTHPENEDFLPILLTKEATLGETPPSRFKLELEGATPDLRHIVFASETALTPGASGGGYRNLYEWSAEGGLELVSITPYAILGEDDAAETAGLHPISDDGSVVFFTDEVDLYARVNSTGSVIRVDASDGGPESGRGRFQTASSDGSRVFFTDALRLTSDSTANPGVGLPDLYEYDLKGEQLTDLTVEDPLGANVKGVLGASEDGSYVYFVAGGALAKGATHGCCNLYVWHRGTPATTTLIGSLSPNDESGAIERRPENVGRADDWEPIVANRTSRVAADGLNVVFMSEESLTGYDNRNAETGAREEEVYDYNAGTNALHCVSCDPDGAPPTGPSEIPAGTAYMASRAIYRSRVLSDEEGRARVFFESDDALVPQDTNGQRDVYEWEEEGRGSCHSVGGCVSLISSGTSGSASSFLDASANGSDVFFLTESELVPQDTDQLLDVYDAREGGGFPGPTPAPPACEGEACAAPTSQAVALGAPLSASYVGLGNPPAPGSKPAVKPVRGKSKPKTKTKKENKKRKTRHGAKKARRSARTRGY